jgi:7-cyano-7-deazaguanine synthase in queuosine biosynthesis
MAKPEHIVLCGGASASRIGAGVHHLALHGPKQNVRLRVQDISKRLVGNIPDELADLLEVASYVYAADSAISRGGPSGARMGAQWRRTFRFVIPVRCPNLWASAPVSSALIETLGFLSEDDYHFEFTSLNESVQTQAYFELPSEGDEGFTPDEVILFSGGLDSFAGAVEELEVGGKSVALVSHHSASKIAAAQKHLISELHNRLGPKRLLHIPVFVNMTDGLSHETTHRIRSFLFAALGAVTARLFDLDRIRFFENGVLSLNLPPLAQVVGTQATRTTHPQALAGFRAVLSSLLDRPFEIVNPFMWLTKAEVVERIAVNKFADQIRHTRSCTRVHGMTTLHPHCGRCSQCLDRRFAILAAGLAHEDPEEAYGVALFTDERPVGPDREMALAYVQAATDIDRMDDVAFFARYGEVQRAVGFFTEPTDAVAERILALHKRHAAAVCRVFDETTAACAGILREATLPPSCLLRLVVGQGAIRAGVELDTEQRHAALQPKVQHPPGTSAVSANPDIRLAVEEGGNCVVFDRWGVLTGSNARLIAVLAESYRQSQTEQLAPERYCFTPTAYLAEALGLENDESLRRTVLRCRKRLGKIAIAAGEVAPALDAVIESSQRHGYRLNPDTTRLVAMTEINQAR